MVALVHNWLSRWLSAYLISGNTSGACTPAASVSPREDVTAGLSFVGSELAETPHRSANYAPRPQEGTSERPGESANAVPNRCSASCIVSYAAAGAG